MKRVTDPADPRRCKHSFPDEQCWNEAEYGVANCAAHGGRSTEEATKKRLYNLAVADDQRQLAELATHESVKSLREEVALMRMMIQRRWNMVRDDAEMAMAIPSINSMMLTVDKLLKTCHTLEQSLGELLSKQAVIKLGQAFCQIVIEELQDVEGHELIIDRIVNRLMPAVMSAQNPVATQKRLAGPR